MVNRKNVLDEHDHFILLCYSRQPCLVPNALEKVVRLTNFNILITTKAMLMNLDSFLC